MASTVISFRLNTENEDEANALTVFTEYESAGYSRSQIFIMALLKLGEVDPITPQFLGEKTREMIFTVAELKEVLQDLRTSGLSVVPHPNTPEPAQDSTISADDPIIASLINRKNTKRRQD